MKCQKCGVLIDPALKIGFRAECPQCGSDLHTCTHCRYFAPGKPNDCLVPGTEWVRDREASNLCEDFKPHSSEPKLLPIPNVTQNLAEKRVQSADFQMAQEGAVLETQPPPVPFENRQLSISLLSQVLSHVGYKTRFDSLFKNPPDEYDQKS